MAKKPIPVTLGMILQANDTIRTMPDAKVKLLIWEGDKKKSIFGDSVFILSSGSDSKKADTGILSSMNDLIRQKYNQLAGMVVQSENKMGAIRSLPSSVPAREKITNFPLNTILLLYPRNESVLENKIEFDWVNLPGEKKYKFTLEKDGVILLIKETGADRLLLSYDFTTGEKYFWKVEEIGNEQKIADKAFFIILNRKELNRYNLEIDEVNSKKELTERQKVLIKAFIKDKWELYTEAIENYNMLFLLPNSEIWEIIGFQRMSYDRMNFPENEDLFYWYVENIK